MKEKESFKPYILGKLSPKQLRWLDFAIIQHAAKKDDQIIYGCADEKAQAPVRMLNEPEPKT